MANELKTIVAKVGSAIGSGVAGSQYYDFPVNSVSQLPAGIVLIEDVDPQVVLGQGRTMFGNLRIICLTGLADNREAFLRIYDYMNSTGSGTSFIAALRADPTFASSCDDTRIEKVENVGVRDIAGGLYASFDILLSFMKSVPA